VKRFRSRFERIQHVREQQERLARIEASVRNAKLAEAEQQSAAADERLQSVLRELVRTGSRPASVAMLRALHSGTSLAEQLIDKAEEHRHAAEQDHEHSLAEFEVARTNVRIMDKLVAAERQRHRQEVRRTEEADALERAVRQHTMRSMKMDGQES